MVGAIGGDDVGGGLGEFVGAGKPDNRPNTNARAVLRGSTRAIRPAIRALTASKIVCPLRGLQWDQRPPPALRLSTQHTMINAGRTHVLASPQQDHKLLLDY